MSNKKNHALTSLAVSMLLIFVCTFSLAAVDAALSNGLGDVDSNGDVNIVDALMTAQSYVGLNPTGFQSWAADVNGDNTINIVDALIIAQYYVGLLAQFPASVTPTPPPASIITLQAEDAAYNDALVETEYTGYTGSGYVNTTNAAGTYLEWTILASSGGDAQCTFTFANGSGTSRAMQVTVNGSVAISSLVFPDTGDWAAWTTTMVTVYLNAGSNALRLTSLDDTGAPNLDKLEISFSGTLTTPTPGPATPTPTSGGAITIWMAGDSTMANGGSSCPIGYGKMFGNFFNNQATVINGARGGRSINTWMYNVLDTANSAGDCDIVLDSSGNKTITSDWQAFLDGMQSGDYLIISFGINDGTSVCPRHADEATFKEDMGIMIDAARARGTNPILLTPVSAIACSGSVAQPTRGGYVDYTIAVGQQYGVPVIDLHQLSINLYNSLGFCPLPNGASDVSSSTGGAVGAFFCDDHTHFDTTGATAIAELVADAIVDQGLPLAAYRR